MREQYRVRIFKHAKDFENCANLMYDQGFAIHSWVVHSNGWYRVIFECVVGEWR
jgi:hypothetical protein